MNKLCKINLIVFSIMLIGILLISPSINAANFDNTKSFDKSVGTYGKVTITNMFGLGSKLAELELKENTNYCDLTCSSETEIIINEDGILIDDIRFLNIKNNKVESIIDYKFYIKTGTTIKEIDIYTNNTEIVGKRYEEVPIWKEYKLGDKVKVGTYYVKLEGIKEKTKSVDWQITSQGKLLDDWAIWKSSYNVGLVYYYNMSELTGTMREAVYGKQNGTLVGTTRTTGGKVGRGYIFDGNDYVNVTNSTNFPVTGNSSIGGWILLNATANTGYTAIKYGIPINGNITKLEFDNYNFGWVGFGDTCYVNTGNPEDRWIFATLVYNGTTGMKVYLNGTLKKECILSKRITLPGRLTSATNDNKNKLMLSYNIDASPRYFTGQMDEIFIYNRSLSSTEIYDMYNSGIGMTYGVETSVELNSPTNDSTINKAFFNASATPKPTFSLSNITFYVWFNNGTLLNKTTKVLTGTSKNTTTLNITSIKPNNYKWGAKGCALGLLASECKYSYYNYTFKYGAVTNLITWNKSTFETATETFILNITPPSGYTPTNGKLFYNGSSSLLTITSSADDYILTGTKTITQIGSNSQNRSFHFSWNLGSINYNSTVNSQNITKVVLSFCNSTFTSRFLNFSFKDESTLAKMNASVDLATFTYWLGNGVVTKTYIYQNTTHNYYYPFCFSKPGKTITIDLSFKYSDTGYPLRTFTYDNQVLTNVTTNKILYLLGSTDGIYSTLQFLDAGTNNPIQSVAVTAEREIGGIWTLIAQGLTDATGSVTFWVNPDYEHRITGTKLGYASVSETITPTQTAYTIFMGSSSNVSIPGYRYKNIRYITYPSAGRLNPNQIYKFGFNITATDGNLVSCKIDIKNLTLNTVATSSVGCGAYGGNVSVSYNVGTNQKLFGYYYVNIGNGIELFKANDAWFIEYLNVSSSGGLLDFFKELDSLPEWGTTHNRQEFSKIVFFFFIMILTIGLFTYFSGYELSSPGAALIIVWAFIAFGSVAGIISIEGLSPFAWWNQYGIFMITSFLLFGFILNTMRRESS